MKLFKVTIVTKKGDRYYKKIGAPSLRNASSQINTHFETKIGMWFSHGYGRILVMKSEISIVEVFEDTE